MFLCMLIVCVCVYIIYVYTCLQLTMYAHDRSNFVKSHPACIGRSTRTHKHEFKLWKFSGLEFTGLGSVELKGFRFRTYKLSGCRT